MPSVTVLSRSLILLGVALMPFELLISVVRSKLALGHRTSCISTAIRQPASC